MKQFSLAFLALCAVLLTAGCANTIRGAGQDAANTVDATGDAVETVTE